MEFKYCDGQNKGTPSTMLHPFSAAAYVSENRLQGPEFVPSSFLGNVPVPRVFPTPVPINVEEEAFQREMEKEQIRRQIMANEMALARRQELEEEVRREMAAEGALRIPMQRTEGISFRQRDSMPLNNRPIYHNNVFGGPLQINVRERSCNTNTNTNKDNVIVQVKPDIDHYGAKRKAEIPPIVDDYEHSPCNLEKKPKQGWSCALCQVTTTSEKGLNDHLQGKKHKAKEASLRTRKIGLDSRPDR